MKVAGVIIQNRNITVYTEKEFDATYKGKHIYITANNGYERPKEQHLSRYDINVIDKSGMYDVQACKDLHTMRDAIIYALNGACLIP